MLLNATNWEICCVYSMQCQKVFYNNIHKYFQRLRVLTSVCKCGFLKLFAGFSSFLEIHIYKDNTYTLPWVILKSSTWKLLENMIFKSKLMLAMEDESHCQLENLEQKEKFPVSCINWNVTGKVRREQVSLGMRDFWKPWPNSYLGTEELPNQYSREFKIKPIYNQVH